MWTWVEGLASVLYNSDSGTRVGHRKERNKVGVLPIIEAFSVGL